MRVKGISDFSMKFRTLTSKWASSWEHLVGPVIDIFAPILTVCLFWWKVFSVGILVIVVIK